MAALGDGYLHLVSHWLHLQVSVALYDVKTTGLGQASDMSCVRVARRLSFPRNSARPEMI